jgi:peptidoglycan/LPS O-acetylase OafA/YrhL
VLSTGSRSGARAARTLRERFDTRRNSLSVLRLVLAAVVALVHAQALGWDDQPRLGHTQIGDLAVDAFFVISGFLVAGSALRLPTLRRFLWHRALRILPGFWVCLLVVAVVVAPLVARLQGRPAGGIFTGNDSSLSFVTHNLALLIRQWDISGLNATSGDAAMDGALWTLFYEALCYLAIGVLVAFGLLRRERGHSPAEDAVDRAVRSLGPVAGLADRLRTHALLVATAAVWLLQVGQLTGAIPAAPDHLARFLMMFLLGAVAHVYADRITFPPLVIVGAAMVLGLALTLTHDYRPLGAPAFGYLLLWGVVALPLRWQPSADLSYGVYVYHWPVEVVLVNTDLPGAGRIAFALIAIGLTGVVAYASWRLVEAPTLNCKNAAWLDRLSLLRPGRTAA